MRKTAIAILCTMAAAMFLPMHADTMTDMGLQTVVVTATRTPKALSDIPVITRVITAEDIEKTDATNIRDLLQQELPGLEFTYSMGHQVLNMGGYDGGNILFLVDGERMAGESMDNIDFSRLDMSNIERIEIVKGAGSTLYGSAAMGGVVNIITKSPSADWTARLHSRYEGAMREWRHGVSGDFTAGRVSSLTSFQMTRNGSLPLQGEESSITTAYGGKTYNVKERLTWSISDDWKLTARGSYFFRERNSSDYQHERYRDLAYGVRSDWTISDRQRLEASYSFDQYDKSNFDIIGRSDVRTYSNRQNTGKLLYSHDLPSLRTTLTAGADFMNDYLLSYQFADGAKSHVQNAVDAFLQWDYTPAERWNIVGGVRYDYFSAARRGMATWKLAGLYKAGAHHLRLSYASAFRAPSLKELYMNFFMGDIFMIYGNADLLPETNHNFSLSWTHSAALSAKMSYSLTAAGYLNFYRNYITYATVQTAGYTYLKYANVGNQKICAADLTLQLRHQGGLGVKLAYAFVKNIVPEGSTDLTTARPHSLTWRIDYDRRLAKNYRLAAALSGRFLSSVDAAEFTAASLTNARTLHYEAYSLWKLTLSQHFGKNFTLNLAADNIFNYKPRNYYPNSPCTTGTTLTAGVIIDI